VARDGLPALDHHEFGDFIQTHKNDRQNKGVERADVSMQHHHALAD
jgi:hypothetical protein